MLWDSTLTFTSGGTNQSRRLRTARIRYSCFFLAYNKARDRLRVEHTATELADALAVAGKRDEALKVLVRAQDVPWKTFGAALVHTGLEEKDEAFRSLDKAIDLRAPFVTLLKIDPRFDSLRQDPRFQNLLHRMNLPE
jgi:hypothetical protein